MLTFDKAFDRLIGHEGGYVNDPNDAGGETKFGISKRSYPHLNIKDLTREQAKAIYLEDFWDKVGDYHPAVRWQGFDFAVNSGISIAITKLQQAIGVADDGHWGPISSAKLKSLDLNDVLFRYIGRRIRFMVSCRSWLSHGAGWMNRMALNLDYAAQDN
jgi:lysozyme family protein